MANLNGILPKTFVPSFHDPDVVCKMEYNDFGKTGLKVSKLSLGTGGFSHLYGDFNLEQCRKTVLEAIKSGVNYIDTAPWYGQGVSEETLGICLEGIPREAYYLATKIGRYELAPEKMFDFSKEKTKESIEKSLLKLKLSYVDILQIHDIEFAPSIDMILDETLPAVQEIVNSGKAKFIGITGYPVSVLSECVKKSKIKIDSVLSYCRLTMFDSTLLDYLNDFKLQGLGVVNASVLGMGLLTNNGPQNWHPADENLKSICKTAGEFCKKNNVELAKIATDYSLKKSKEIPTNLIGMKTVEELRQHLDVLVNDLNDKEKEVSRYLIESVFPKTNHHWEGVEIESAKKNITKF